MSSESNQGQVQTSNPTGGEKIFDFISHFKPAHLFKRTYFDHIKYNISNFNILVISCLGVTSAQAQQIRRIHGTIRLACADQKVCLGHRW